MNSIAGRIVWSVGSLLLASNASGQVLGPWIKTAGDGGKAVFVSDQALVPEDHNNTRDVYLYDYSTGLTSLVSATPQGVSGNGESDLPYLSADGNVVVFLSYATDLAPGAPLSTAYVRDLRAGTTSILWSQSDSIPLAITPDARFIVISVPGGGGQLLLVVDRASGSIEEVDVNNAGQQMDPSYPYSRAAISADGRYVAFNSNATNVDPIDDDPSTSIYVRDRFQGVTFLASERNGVNLPDQGYSLAMSRDGRFLAFNGFGTFPPLSIFVRDLATSDVRDVGPNMPPIGLCPTVEVVGITDDGSRLLLTQHAYEIHQPGFPCTDPFERTLLVDLSSDPVKYAQGPVETIPKLRDLSADGQWIVSVTYFPQVARTSIATTTPSPWFYCNGKQNSLGCIPDETFSGLASLSGADHLVVSASNLRNQTSALILWGNGWQSVPFFGGTLCIVPPLHRTPLQSTGGSIGVHDCSGTASFDFTSSYLAQHALGIGSSVYTQVYARDPGFPIPNNVQLSSAVAFVVVP